MRDGNLRLEISRKRGYNRLKAEVPVCGMETLKNLVWYCLTFLRLKAEVPVCGMETLNSPKRHLTNSGRLKAEVPVCGMETVRQRFATYCLRVAKGRGSRLRDGNCVLFCTGL